MTAPGRKVCFITGASGKLGSEIALAVAGQGYRICFTWHTSEKKAEKLLEQLRWISPESTMIQCDVSKTEDIRKAFKTCRERFERLDLLVASASNFYPTPLPEVTEEAWDNLVDTNLKGAFFTMQEAAAIMERQPFTSRIITMTDVAAELSWTGFAPYTAAKAGLTHLTKVFAKRFAPTILVNAIAPGSVAPVPERDKEGGDAPLGAIPLGRPADPLDIVRTVLFLMENDYMTGQILAVDGGRLLR